jgi:4-aminobutyrate aminotransferase / (S)-3-amino-2-methylpropionate transaminase / 5-aminovalerate transaminase
MTATSGSSIRLRTAIPGPNSKRLMQRRESSVPRGVYHFTPVFVSQAEGALLEDVDGNWLLDFAGGIGCMNVGHRAPSLVRDVGDQLQHYLHACFHVTPYEGYVRLAERLNALSPGDFPKKTLLLNSGAEAVENAVKIARAYTGRSAVICFEDAFHGRTLLAMSLTSKTHPYKRGFEPGVGEVFRVPYAYCYRCTYSLRYPECGVHCAHHLKDTFRRTVAAESVAAIIVEPVLGEGGFISPPAEFFAVLQDICQKHGILLIADEVQTGFGRTGSLFACERLGIEPDLLVTAKSLGGGLPISAVTGRADVMDAPEPGGLGGTFGGNPLACAAALSVIEMFAPSDGKRANGLDLSSRARALGERFVARARDWQQRWPAVGDIRGLGAMQAIELVQDPVTREPATEVTARIVRACYERGLVLLSAGSYGNVLRILSPLVITDEQFEEGLSVIEAAMASVGLVESSISA